MYCTYTIAPELLGQNACVTVPTLHKNMVQMWQAVTDAVCARDGQIEGDLDLEHEQEHFDSSGGTYNGKNRAEMGAVTARTVSEVAASSSTGSSAEAER